MFVDLKNRWCVVKEKNRKKILIESELDSESESKDSILSSYTDPDSLWNYVIFVEEIGISHRLLKY